MSAPSGRSLLIPAWILSTIALLWFLRTARALLIPIAVAVLLSYAVEPVVARLARARVPRALGAALVLLLLTGLFAWGVYALRDEVSALLAAAPAAAAKLSAWAGMSDPIEAADSPGVILQGIGWLLSGAGNLTIVVMLAYFLLLSGEHFKRRVVETAGPGEQKRATADVFEDINDQIQRFLLVQVFTSVVVGVATWAVLAWMSVPQAAVWGIGAGLFNSIPYFGPVIVSGGLFVVGMVQSGDPAVAGRMAGATLLVTSLEGWLLNPVLMGKAEHMHVVAVFVGVLVWTWLWGAWGTILAVPMMVVLKAVCDHVDGLKPISRLLAR
ncbi:MAG: AI-2E family transporter [Acidobacteriota bacterium]|nr:AI-2E family transporter [Acidobacteriota bacterium]